MADMDSCATKLSKQKAGKMTMGESDHLLGHFYVTVASSSLQ